MLVKDLQGAELDYWTCKAEKRSYSASGSPIGPPTYSPSTDWSQGGPIIEREKIEIVLGDDRGKWEAAIKSSFQYGPTPAGRAFAGRGFAGRAFAGRVFFNCKYACFCRI